MKIIIKIFRVLSIIISCLAWVGYMLVTADIPINITSNSLNVFIVIYLFVLFFQNYCGLIEADDVVENMHVFGKQKKIDEWFSEQVKDGIEAGYIPEENPDEFIRMKDYELTMSKGNEKDGFTCYGIVCRPFDIEK